MRSTSLVLATALCHAAMLCHAASTAIQRPRAVQYRGFALLRANGRSPAPRKRVHAFSTARCSVSGAGCATLHRDQRLADRRRARRLVRAARRAALGSVVNKLEPQIATERHTLRERPHTCDAVLTERTRTPDTQTHGQRDTHSKRGTGRQTPASCPLWYSSAYIYKCVQISGYICICTYIRSDGGLAGDAERSTSLVLATADSLCCEQTAALLVLGSVCKRGATTSTS